MQLLGGCCTTRLYVFIRPVQVSEVLLTAGGTEQGAEFARATAVSQLHCELQCLQRLNGTKRQLSDTFLPRANAARGLGGESLKASQLEKDEMQLGDEQWSCIVVGMLSMSEVS